MFCFEELSTNVTYEYVMNITCNFSRLNYYKIDCEIFYITPKKIYILGIYNKLPSKLLIYLKLIK